MTISRGRTERLYQAVESKADQKRIDEEIIFYITKNMQKKHSRKIRYFNIQNTNI